MIFMGIFSRRKSGSSTPFSDFIRNASSRDKKRVYERVLKKATERQKAVLERRQQATE